MHTWYEHRDDDLFDRRLQHDAFGYRQIAGVERPADKEFCYIQVKHLGDLRWQTLDERLAQVMLDDATLGDAFGRPLQHDAHAKLHPVGQRDSVEVHMDRLLTEDVPLHLFDHHNGRFAAPVTGQVEIDKHVHACVSVDHGREGLAIHRHRPRISSPAVEDGGDLPRTTQAPRRALADSLADLRFERHSLHTRTLQHANDPDLRGRNIAHYSMRTGPRKPGSPFDRAARFCGIVVDKMVRIHRLADDLFLIDTHYVNTPEAVGVYLLLGERPALIETGPGSTLETVLAGIHAAGIDPVDLQAVAVTHIHLDHAGATGGLVHRYPHLDVYVHPLGAPHLIDPSRLVASAGRLYGADLPRLFGEVIPVPAARVHPLDDGAEVALGSRRLVAYDTPGHARHHLAYHDRASGDLFTGDAAGVALPGSHYVRPPTPPPELDIAAWDRTIARLRALQPRRLLLTHFGPHEWADDLLVQLQRRLHAFAQVVRDGLAAGEDDDTVVERVRTAAERELAATDGQATTVRFETIMAVQQSALGLIRYVKTREAPTAFPRSS
jgi:glyoxylase-like metal-dependent hydrolase (beta-lactamase superfamily II)